MYFVCLYRPLLSTVALIFVGDFNFGNIDWYPTQIGASARCYNLSDNEMRFINSLRKNMYI